MGLGKIVKLISKNMTIITIGAAFVLGFIGMSDVKAVLLNPSDDSVALFDTSTWFKKNDTGNAAGEDEGLRIVSEIGLSDEEIEAMNTRGSSEDAVETDEDGNPVDPSAASDDPALATDENSSETTEESTSETTADATSTTDTSDPSLSESSTAATTEDPKATTTKTSETTKESTTVTTTEETTTEAPETTTEATEPPTENTEPPETTTEAPPPETTEAPPETTTEAPPETTTEAPPETTTEAPPPETTTEAPDSMGATGGSYDGDWAKTVLSLVNDERAANGLGPLEWSGGLAKAAKIRATEIVVKWSHTRPDGSEWWTVSDLTYGENLAYGQTSPSEVVEAWMNSSGHKANILSSSFTTLGVACYCYDGTYYWVQEFGY